jgi:PTS system nitrogen regulatory IIA component
MEKISKYLEPSLILFFEAESRDSALHKLVDLAEKQGKLEDAKAFYEAIIDRERIVSTGIGMGIAIPHAKLPSYDHFFIAIGFLTNGVEWNAIDGAPVRLIFMIGGPDDKQTEYLQLLSALTIAVKDEDRRKKILNSSTPIEIIENLTSN